MHFWTYFKDVQTLHIFEAFCRKQPSQGNKEDLQPHGCLVPACGCHFLAAPKSSLRERGAASMIYSISVFGVLWGPCAVGLVGVECCPAPSAIGKSGTSQMATCVIAVSWQQADLSKKTKHITESPFGPKQKSFLFELGLLCAFPSKCPHVNSTVSSDIWST